MDDTNRGEVSSLMSVAILSKCAIPLVAATGEGLAGAGGGASRWVGFRIYLESLLMTRMSAPFSSFSLWLSAFKSGSI